MSEQRGNLYLLTGLLIGLFLGLLVAWVISPVQYTDISPSALDSIQKDAYRRVIALAYQANGNLDRTRERLALIDPAGSIQVLAAQAQRMLAEDQTHPEARALAMLAADLGKMQDAAAVLSTSTPAALSAATESTRVESQSNTPVISATAVQETVIAVQTPTIQLPTRTATVTETPLPTFTPRPTATPLPILDSPYILQENKEICDGSIIPYLLQIEVFDAQQAPKPGIQLSITWQGGEEVFYTGFYPEISPGYADFLMEPGRDYFINIGTASDPVSIQTDSNQCGYRLSFVQ